MTTLWQDVRSSIFKFCADFATEVFNDGVSEHILFNWDAHVEENALPDADLIGPYQLTMDVDGSLITVRGMIGVSVIRDPNLFRLEEVCGLLIERLLPDSIIQIYQAETSAPSGKLKVAEGTSLSPAARAQQRSLKFVSFVLKSDRTISKPQ